MAKILTEIDFMFSNSAWLKQKVGEDLEIFGPLLGWASMADAIDRFPGEANVKLTLATICARAVAPPHAVGFCAGLTVMERLGIASPVHGRPGFVGALGMYGGEVILEAKDAWERAREHFADIEEELNAYDQMARESIAAVIADLDVPPQWRDQILEVSVGFEKPAQPRTPTRSGFISAFAWKRYVEDSRAPVAVANQRTFELLAAHAKADALVMGEEPSDLPRPNPFPRDFRCTCGEELDRYLFCCNPSRLHTRASLKEVDEHFQLAPCEGCGASLFGFNCDGCGAAHCWVFGVVDSHQAGS